MGTCEHTHSGTPNEESCVGLAGKASKEGREGVVSSLARQVSVLKTEKEGEQASHWAELTGGRKARQVNIQAISQLQQPFVRHTQIWTHIQGKIGYIQTQTSEEMYL